MKPRMVVLDAEASEPTPPKPIETQLAPGAPDSPGPMPDDLSRALEHGEALVWWNEKANIDLRAVGFVVLIPAIVLAILTVLLPEFWGQDVKDLWKPLAAIFAPVALVLWREWTNRAAIVVTDTSIIMIPARGQTDRLRFGNVRRVRRDRLRGTIRLQGATHEVWVPPILLDDTRAAIASQRHQALGSAGTPVDDPMAWLP